MRVGLVVVVVGLAACEFQHGALSPRDDAPFTGSEAIIPDSQLGAWGTPVDIGISSGVGDDDPSLTDDLLEIYFGSRRDPLSANNKDEDIYFATRATISSPWSEPMPVDILNTSSYETTMKITGDGLTLFFTSNRNGNYDVYMATRANRSAAWEIPGFVDELSSSGGDYATFAQSNLRHVIQCVGPTGVATEALYTSDRASTSDPWPEPTRLSEIDDPGISECDPNEPHPRALYYSTQYLTGGTSYDIYRVSRATVTDPYGSRTKVEGVNVASFNDRDPWVSADERTMFFSSDRVGGTDRIYMTTR
jgi:hypothetical protein